MCEPYLVVFIFASLFLVLLSVTCLNNVLPKFIKNLLAVWETWAQSLSWECPLEKGKATHSSILTLCDPMDYPVHGILQARILE